jgi:ATP-dependent Lon protease
LFGLQVIAIPLTRRPLLPGIVMNVPVTDESIIKELNEMLEHKGQALFFVCTECSLNVH